MDALNELLLENSDKVHDKDASGSTPLHIACKQGNIHIVQLLGEHGADPNAINFDGKTPLDLGGIEVQDYFKVSPSLRSNRIIIFVIKSCHGSTPRSPEETRPATTAFTSAASDRRNDDIDDVRLAETIRQRCREAVPVVIRNCNSEILNGVYDPIPNSLHCDWPVYEDRNTRSFVLIFHVSEEFEGETVDCDDDDDVQLASAPVPASDGEGVIVYEWLLIIKIEIASNDREVYRALQVENINDSYEPIFNPNAAYLRLRCHEPMFPEFVGEDKKDITDYGLIDGSFRELLPEECRVEIMTETAALSPMSPTTRKVSGFA